MEQFCYMFADIWTVCIDSCYVSGFIFWDNYARSVCWSGFRFIDSCYSLLFLAVYGFLSGSILHWMCIPKIGMSVGCVLVYFVDKVFAVVSAFLLTVNWMNDMKICNALYRYRYKSICDCFYLFVCFYFSEDWIV